MHPDFDPNLHPSLPQNNFSVKWVMSIGQQVTMTGSIFSPIWPFDRICIRVRYGIKSKELFFLKTEDLKQIKDGQYDFETKIKFFSSKLWSSSGKVFNTTGTFFIVRYQIETVW